MIAPAQPPSPVDQALRAGITHHQAGELAEAERIYRRVLEMSPRNAYALHLLVVVAHQCGKNEAALDLIDRALAIEPDLPDAWNNRANTLNALKRSEEALASYDRALALKPDYPGALTNRAFALMSLGRLEAALVSFDRALALQPDSAAALRNRGDALQALKRHAEALACFDTALSHDPEDAEVLNNRGNALHALGNLQEALASYDKALALRPSFPEALSNRANVLHALDRSEEALKDYDLAIELKPDFAQALGNRGNALGGLRRYEEALASYRAALRIDPANAETSVNEAMCHLVTGNFARGLDGYERRWQLAGRRDLKRNFAQPLWLGKESIAGKTLLLHCEQGFGDTIQFARYAQLLSEMDAKVLLLVQPALKRLMATLPGVDRVLAEGETLPDFDLHCPLLSLPLAFGTRVDSIPGGVPYLKPPAGLVPKWIRKLPDTKGRRIGIFWSGRVGRPIAVEALASLAGPDHCLVSLQKEVRPEDEGRLAQSKVLRFNAELSDFADTAALVSLLDLVISVDSAVAHLAGALGKSVWVLLPFNADWRWLTERADSPWYPTARLFRQPIPGDWKSVMAAVKRGLSKFRA